MVRSTFILGAALLLAPVSAASAQGGWWEPVADRQQSDSGVEAICRMRPSMPVCSDRRGDARSPETRDRTTRDRRDRDGSDQARGRRGGPPFCSNGQGHPVHGMAWCREKGFGTGGLWRDAGWGDITFGRDVYGKRNQTLGRGGLLDTLGDVILRRLESQPAARQGPLVGRFLVDGPGILQVRAGSVPLAELMDVNGDGRVDRVLLYRDQ